MGGLCVLSDRELEQLDMKNLSESEAVRLCRQLREDLIQNVSRTGGHFASNLGAVELTVALHRAFDLNKDRLVFDVGHQCYPHKMLTGRADAMATIRQFGGIAGFPKPSESACSGNKNKGDRDYEHGTRTEPSFNSA